MNIEELKKIVRGKGFQESHGSTTIVIDVETVIDLIDEYKAINYTRCCKSDSELLKIPKTTKEQRVQLNEGYNKK